MCFFITKKAGVLMKEKFLGMGAGVIGICINYVWGGLDAMLTALIGLMILDFIAGVLCGSKAKCLNSKTAYLGITQKKMMILIMVAVAVIVDSLVNTDGTVRSLVIFYYISMEGISILENAGKLGFPIPEKLKDILVQLQEEE